MTFAIVVAAVNLPNRAESARVGVTAVRVRTTEGPAAYHVFDDPMAATLQEGEWIEVKELREDRATVDLLASTGSFGALSMATSLPDVEAWLRGLVAKWGQARALHPTLPAMEGATQEASRIFKHIEAVRRQLGTGRVHYGKPLPDGLLRTYCSPEVSYAVHWLANQVDQGV